MRPGVGRIGVMRALFPRVALVAASLLVLPVHAETIKRVSVSGFTKLDLKLPLDVTVRPGKEFSLTLSVRDSEVADKITAEVHGDTLVISTNEHSLRTHGKDKATLIMPDLRGVSISGSGNVDVAGFEQGVAMSMEIAGSGDITYSGKTSALAVAVAGSGNVRLKGSTGSLSVNIEGSGDLQASEFSAKNASVAVNGSGDADLRVSGAAVQCNVNGSGANRWDGDPSVWIADTHAS
jgi:hypothetical protein